MKIGEILWLAFVYAKQDRLSIIAAYSGDKSEPVVQAAEWEIAAFEKLQKRLFGTTKTELEAAMEKMQPRDIMKMLQEEQA